MGVRRARLGIAALLVTWGIACGAPAPSPIAARSTALDAGDEVERAEASRPGGSADAGGGGHGGGPDGGAPALDSGLDGGRLAEQKPPAHHPPWPIASPCVDVNADMVRRLHGAPPQEILRWDLDLDGENDWVVVVASQPDQWRSQGWVYLARGACGHFAAEWSGGLPQPGGEGEILLVEEPCKNPVRIAPLDRCCPKTTHWRYFWDGKQSYRRRDTLTSSRTCGVQPY